MPPEPGSPPAVAQRRRRRLPLAGLGLAAALAFFGWGIVHLFELRFAGGDVYPAYSTLRKDPLGAAAFHDALAALPGLSVERNLRPLATLAQTPKLLLGPLATPDPAASPGGQAGPLVCFYLGADAYEWPGLFRHNEFERLDAIMRQGGRVVLTFLPGQTPLSETRLENFRRDQADEEGKSTPATSPASASPTPSASPTKGFKRPVPTGMRMEDLVERWGIDFRRVKKIAKKDQHSSAAAGAAVRASPTPAADDPRLPRGQRRAVRWRTRGRFPGIPCSPSISTPPRRRPPAGRPGINAGTDPSSLPGRSATGAANSSWPATRIS